MKKLFAAAAVAVIMAVSAVPAFAASVDSPVAKKQCDPKSSSTTVVKDTGAVSPKTGNDSLIAFSAIALTSAACGASTLFAVKKAKAKK